jgi:hypothetical protein
VLKVTDDSGSPAFFLDNQSVYVGRNTLVQNRMLGEEKPKHEQLL